MDFTNKKTLDFLINKLDGLREKSAELIELNKRNIEVTIYNIQECLSSGAVTVTKDNIHLYCEFMSNNELEKYNSLIDDILKDRIIKIHTALNIDFLDFIDNYITSSFFEDNYISLISFGVKDTLKPINEHIEEIKASDAYKQYIAKNS